MTKLSVDQALTKAKFKIRKNNILEAKKLLKSVLINYPKNLRIQKLLTSISKCQQTHSTQSLPYDIEKELINLYNKKQFVALNDQAELLTSKYPNAFFLWNILGVSSKILGKIEKASKAFKKVTELNPKYADGFNNLGVTLEILEKYDDAIASFKKALSIKPDYAVTYLNLGISLKYQGKYDEAIEAFKKSLQLKPNNAKVYYNIGKALRKAGKPDKAIEAFKKALSIKPDYIEACNNIGAALTEQGKLDKAIDAYKRLTLLKPSYVDGFVNIGFILVDQGKYEEAIEAYNQALLIKPDYVEVYNNLGNIFQKKGNFNEALKLYNKALLYEPDNAETYYRLGNMHKNLGRVKEAKSNYLQAIKLKPDHSSASHMLAAITGLTTSTAPLEYVEKLFDYYSSNFENSLIDSLDYKIPKILAKIIMKYNKSNTLGSVTDLGCGTGLFGKEIKQNFEYLEGVDLSKKMLLKAEKKNVYNKLIKQNIVTYLSNANLNFNYFILTDVFIYIGDLHNIFQLIKSRNKIGGKLAFSIENYYGNGFFLEKTGRYSHSKDYIESLCKKFGYNIQHFETHNIRKEKSEYIIGSLYLLEF